MQRWLWLSVLAVALLTSVSAHSQSLRDALEGAWSTQPAARAIGPRADELAAKRDAATAPFPSRQVSIWGTARIGRTRTQVFANWRASCRYRFGHRERAMEFDAHPQLAAASHTVAAARAKLGQATAAPRNPPEIELGLRRERGAFGGPYANSVVVGIELPFGTNARNRPRITAANAEFSETDAALMLERQKLTAEIEGATVELEQARESERLRQESAKSGDHYATVTHM